MKGQKGFTLIELMIVVAIIGVLSAVAIPAYKDYVTKSEASSGLATMKALITPAELYIQESGDLATTTTLDKIGTTGTENTLGTITISAENTLLFTFNNTSSLNSETITLARDDTTGWACTLSTNMPNVDGCS
ncbi:pilin [Photobacterium damselae subsp. damselae]|uniref:pilin n=1 Tax=Photobacterium damselae TaxID=38293 RepID=UPI000D064957|nr:pilin [Photobacterium damselae]PSB77033.1 pilus assembly protein PilA [Photobacterium damselae subsp. damselae]